MLDIPDQRISAPAAIEKVLQAIFALGERQVTQILAVSVKEVERKIGEILRSSLGKRSLKSGEVRRPVDVKRHNLPIDDAVRERACRFRGRGKPVGPVKTLAGPQDGFPV